MKFTLKWLKEHLDTKASVDQIAGTLTRIGLEVEELFDPAKALAPFRDSVKPAYAKAKEKYGADVDAILADPEAVRKAVPAK